MIYDAFLFHAEYDLLKIRCEALLSIPGVQHILVESEQTFTGIEKPLHFIDNLELFKDYNILPFSTGITPFDSPWDSEKYQRDHILQSIASLGPADDDTIIISDVDEIPNPSAISQYTTSSGMMALLMDQFYYFLNTLESCQSWNHARIMPWSYLKDKSPDAVRNAGFNLMIANAGAHYSYTGGVPAMMEKFRSFSHQEPEVQKFAQPLKLGYMITDLLSFKGTQLKVVGDEELPEYVRNNKEKFKHLIYGDV